MSSYLQFDFNLPTSSTQHLPSTQSQTQFNGQQEFTTATAPLLMPILATSIGQGNFFLANSVSAEAFSNFASSSMLEVTNQLQSAAVNEASGLNTFSMPNHHFIDSNSQNPNEATAKIAASVKCDQSANSAIKNALEKKQQKFVAQNAKSHPTTAKCQQQQKVQSMGKSSSSSSGQKGTMAKMASGSSGNGRSGGGRMKKPHSSVERRNARERRRVHTVNQAFHILKKMVPTLSKNTKRVSKLKILRATIHHVRQLMAFLDNGQKQQESIGFLNNGMTSSRSGQMMQW